MQAQPHKGKSARRGNAKSPYAKRHKRPYPYSWECRLAKGDLCKKANDSRTNKYP
jgi:hypothetical protein